jgi:hypothetical protein
MCPVIFDIETGSLPIERLKEIMPPFDPNSLGRHPGEFDPANVKLGNLKDQAKITAKIEDAAIKHAEAVVAFEAKAKTGEVDYWNGIESKAAFSALTAEVLAIGYNGKEAQIDARQGDDESQMLTRFWGQFVKCRNAGRRMVGFNIREFDLPFMIQRSFILGVDIPSSVMNGRYLDATFIDLRDLWRASSINSVGSLDTICRACNLGAKPDGVNGADFGRLFRNPETRHEAISYLSNDLVITKLLSTRFGVV